MVLLVFGGVDNSVGSGAGGVGVIANRDSRKSRKNGNEQHSLLRSLLSPPS